MAKADTSRIEALDAILAEKRKHEGFLTKLEERRATTPANVFTRLRDEYLTKITDLQVRASIEAESLADGLKEDEAAVVEIEARLAAITEERIEGELRAEVGEYDPKEWAERLKALDANLAKIEKERDAKVATFERTRTLLAEARGPVVAAAPAPEAVVPSPAPEPTPAPVARPTPQATVPQPAPRAPSAPQPIVPEAPVVPTMPVNPSPAPAAVPPVPRAATVTPPPAAAAVPPAPVPAAPPVEPAPAPVAAPVAAPRAPATGSPMAGSPSFDELAFLNSVVGRASVPLKAEPPAPRPSRPISELRDTAADRMVASPPAAPAAPASRAPAAGEPIEESESGPLGRPTPRTSQAIKTLKCSECGTLNYPTEWYCERCGGELAAL